MARSKNIDWERIEPEWRAGIKSVLQIAEEFGISHTAINKHFRKLGINRDLSAKIKSKADSIVSKAIVSAKVSTETTVTDAAIIDANANAIALIDLDHRKGIKRSRGIVDSLLSELESLVGDKELYEKLGELLETENTDKMNDLYRKVLSFPGRVESAQKLVMTQKSVIDTERKIVKLDEQERGNETIEDIIARVNAAN